MTARAFTLPVSEYVPVTRSGGTFPCTVRATPERKRRPEVLVMPPVSPAVTLALAVMSNAFSAIRAPSSTVTPPICTLAVSDGSSGAATGMYTESSDIGTAAGLQLVLVNQLVVPAPAVQVRVTPATRMGCVPVRRRPTAVSWLVPYAL